MLEIRLLGTFSIKSDNESVELSSRVAQSLFAYLVLTAGTSHRREKLAGMFWPDVSEEKARAYLRHELWRIRKAFPVSDFLLSNDIGISFDDSKEFHLDAKSLEQLADTASAEGFTSVLSVYQGELLPGFYDEWVIPEREHLQAIFEQKMTRLLDLLEGEKRWTEILEWAEHWIALGQGPEAAYRSLLSAYTALGDRAKVAATYERCVQALAELGLEPSEETRIIAKKRSSKINIPIPLTSFIGRENELKEVAALLSRSRLVTLTGSGGVGKTRLSIQVVADVLERFPDGAWFLDLAPVSDPELVPNILANVLALHPMGGSDLSYTDLIIGYLGSRRALIIFDNCEHLIDASAQLAHSLLTACENLSILATSREALRVSGEIPYRVPSLELPKVDVELILDELSNSESVKLFTERVRVVSPGFAISLQNVLVITQICQRLGGIPLALELAAARVNVLAVEQILQRLDDRFNLLTSGSRTALPRHQTLRATIEWSYDLLPGKERLLFQRLAVFTGGWTLEAAEEVCSGDGIETREVLDLLSQLVDKSLMLAEAGFGETRYRRLETIRQFACEKLLVSGEEDNLRKKQCAYYLELGERADRETDRLIKRKWQDRLEADNDNFRAAFEWCVSERDTETALHLLGGWTVNGRLPFKELDDKFNKILGLPEVNAYHTLYARLLNSMASANWLRGNIHHAKSFAEESQVIWLKLGESGEVGLAECLEFLGEVAISEENSPAAQSFLEKSIELYQKHDDERGVAGGIFRLGHLAMMEERYDAAAAHYMKALEIWKKVDAVFGEWAANNELGILAQLQGDYDRAGKLYGQSLAVARKLRGQAGLPITLYNYAWVVIHTGEYQRARDLLQECLELCIRDGNKFFIIDCLAGLASILGVASKNEAAARLFGAAESLHKSSGAGPRDLSDQKEIDHYLAAVRAQLDETTFAKAWAEGSEMTLEQAVAFALEETRL